MSDCLPYFRSGLDSIEGISIKAADPGFDISHLFQEVVNSERCHKAKAEIRMKDVGILWAPVVLGYALWG